MPVVRQLHSVTRAVVKGGCCIAFALARRCHTSEPHLRTALARSQHLSLSQRIFRSSVGQPKLVGRRRCGGSTADQDRSLMAQLGALEEENR
jgi:hypothetical protein